MLIFFLRIHQTVSQLAAVAPCQLPIVGGLVVPLVLRRGEGDALLAGEVHAEPLLGDRPARLVVVVLHGEVGSRPANTALVLGSLVYLLVKGWDG